MRQTTSFERIRRVGPTSVVSSAPSRCVGSPDIRFVDVFHEGIHVEVERQQL